MNSTMKNQIVSELDSFPDQKGYSLLDYLHFLKQKQKENYPNQKTIDAIGEVEMNGDKLTSYASTDDLFQDLGLKS